MNTITESMIRESIEKNMDEFKEKALRGKVTGKDVADLFGYGEMFTEGEEMENEFNSLRNEVLEEMRKEEDLEEELHIEKDLEGRPVLAEAEEGEEDGSEGNEGNEGTETDNEPESQDTQEDSAEEDSGAEGSDSEEPKEEEVEEPKDDKEKEEQKKGPLKPGETTHLESFEELFNETGTKIRIQKQGIGPEPSPMFGQSSTKHNKYKVSLINDKGGDVSWIYWDSEKNTKDGTVPDTETVMKDFGLKLEAAVVGISLDNFKQEFGYDEIDGNLAQKQYEGLRTMKDSIKKIFPDQHNVYQLIQIAKKT